MTDLQKINKLVTIQELFRREHEIHGLYAEQTKKMDKLVEDNEALQSTADDIGLNISEMDKKIREESDKREAIEGRIASLEENKDKIKIARQLKSWEKDMERMNQELSLIQAQIKYDMGKITEMRNEFERITNRINENAEKIDELKGEIEVIQADHQGELAEIASKIETLRADFEHTFMDYFWGMLKKTKGNAIVEVDEDACSGCNIVLPTHLQGDLGPELSPANITALQCPHCFRYLYYAEWLEYEEAAVAE